MSKVIQLPTRKSEHELDRFFLAPGVIEYFPSDRAINWTRRAAGALLVISLIALVVINRG